MRSGSGVLIERYFGANAEETVKGSGAYHIADMYISEERACEHALWIGSQMRVVHRTSTELGNQSKRERC